MLNAYAPILLNERYYKRLCDLLTQLAAITWQNSKLNSGASVLLGSFSHSNPEMVQATQVWVFSRFQHLQQVITKCD